MKKVLYICSSYYTIMSAMKDAENTDAKVDIVISSCIMAASELAAKLESLKIFNKTYFFDDSEIRAKITTKLHQKSLFSKFIFFIMRNNYKLIKQMLHFPTDFRLNQYDEIYTFNANLPMALVAMGEKRNIVIREDGKRQLRKIYEIGNRKTLFKLLSPFEKIGMFWGLPFGMTKYVIRFETCDESLSGLKLFDKRIAVEAGLDVNFLTNNTKNALISMFNIDDKIKKGDKKLLVLSAELYGIGIVDSEEKQKDVFRQIIHRFKKDGMVVYLKPHPGGDIDYSNFSECIVIEPEFPVELINFVSEPIDLVVTVRSSAIYGVQAKERYFYDLDDFDNGKFNVNGGHYVTV